MAALEELEDLLGGDFSENYWSNDVVLTARNLVGELKSEDWDSLLKLWQCRGKVWQHRLADVASRGEAINAVPLLIPMIETDDDELTLTAADSLSSLAPDVSASVLTAKAKARLEVVAAQSGLNARVIANLKQRLAP